MNKLQHTGQINAAIFGVRMIAVDQHRYHRQYGGQRQWYRIEALLRLPVFDLPG